jgi:two-component system, NarL family, captular synthesis response regulator RcsB
MKIRLILADDHPTVLSGVRYELSRVPTIEIAGTATCTDELVALLSRAACDVLITDYAMPGGDIADGLPLLKYVRRHWPNVRIIVLTTIDNPAMLSEMAKSGAQSVLSKLDDVNHLIAAVHAVHAGATYFSPNVKVRTAPSLPQVSRSAQALTSREAEVVRLYVSGLTISEIAAQLNRAKQTVSAQKVKAMKKLGIERDADLFQYAYETGLAASGTKGED